MAKRNTSININGKRYDALTGAMAHESTVKATKSIDGVVGGHSKALASSTMAMPSIAKPLRAIPASQVPRGVAAHAKAHSITHSKTLMRHVVTKPVAASLKRRAKVQGSTLATVQASAPLHITVTPKSSINHVDARRLSRAQGVAASSKVAHFAAPAAQPVKTTITSTIRVIEPATHLTTQDITSNTRPTMDIFERALARATSHEEPSPAVEEKRYRSKAARQARKRMVTYTASAFAVLALVGIVGYQSVGTIKFKMAANTAGFAATMPSYRPAGFDVSQVKASVGYLGVNFTAPSIESGVNRSYSLTEKPSTWNSSTLLTNIVADANSSDSYQTVEAAGRTIYLYGSNEAAWVNNGILYQVIGQGSLNTNEFSKLAASM